jgi:hypothetical protein
MHCANVVDCDAAIDMGRVFLTETRRSRCHVKESLYLRLVSGHCKGTSCFVGNQVGHRAS